MFHHALGLISASHDLLDARCLRDQEIIGKPPALQLVSGKISATSSP
jgi:hypothetical protein